MASRELKSENNRYRDDCEIEIEIEKRIRNTMIYRIIGESLGLLCVIIFVSCLQKDDFSIVEITKIIIAYLLHKGAITLECRYLLKLKLKNMEDRK